jgi:Methyltransferase FkbM domain
MHGLTSGMRALVDVPLLVGDEYFSHSGIDRPDIVKLDVQGMEANVVLGMKNTIEKFQPIFLMEWNNDVTRQAFAEKALFTTIFKGYNLVGVRGTDARELFPKNALGWFRKKLARLAKARRFVAVRFEEEENFETLVLLPRAKAKLLERFSNRCLRRHDCSGAESF